MREFIAGNLKHVLCGLLLISRLGDIITTRLATPKLRLEANPIVRRLGWPFAVLTVLACLLPYYDVRLAVLALAPFLLVSAANAGKIWFLRAYGEAEYAALVLRLARKSRLSHALAGVAASGGFVVLAGLVLWYLSPDPDADWGHWFGLGVMLYGFIVALYGSLHFIRIFRKARQLPAEEAASEAPPEASGGAC